NWNFGDGNTGTDIDPTNYYTNAGSYTVTLTAIGPGGTNMMAKNNYINVTNAPPAITLQPVDTIVSLGSNALLIVAATGSPPLFYQWRLAGQPLADATNSTLARNNVTCDRAGNYDVTVSNAAGVVYSSVAVLTVVGPPGIATQPADESV